MSPPPVVRATWNSSAHSSADEVIDYTCTRALEALKDYDVVPDSSFDMETDLLKTLKTHAGAAYIIITSAKVRLADEFGLEEGMRRAEELLTTRVVEQARLGRRYFWGFMRPDGAALAQVADLVSRGRIRPLVDRVFPLTDVALAHEYCEAGMARGKFMPDFGQSRKEKPHNRAPSFQADEPRSPSPAECCAR